MDCSYVIINSDAPMVHSCLAHTPNFLLKDQIEPFITSFDLQGSAPFTGLDLSTPSVPMGIPWPQVIIKPLVQLFEEFQMTINQKTNNPFFPAGTMEFYKDRTKKDKKTKKDVWTGSDEDLQRHQDQTKSMNLALLLLAQESLGVDSDCLQVRLRFFTAEDAKDVMSGNPFTSDLWRLGQARPDSGHLCLVLREETKNAINYACFSLVINP